MISSSLRFTFLGLTLPALPVLTLSALLVGGCTTLSYLEEGERLYTGTQVEIEVAETHSVPRARRVVGALRDSARPIPNSSWLGTARPKLWVYRVTGGPEAPRLLARIGERYGEPPVLFDQVSPEATTRAIRSWLDNHGFFDSEIEMSLDEAPGLAGLHYTVLLREPYRVASIAWPQDATPLSGVLRDLAQESLVEPRSQYRLDTLLAERRRIDHGLKEAGYYAFHPSYLVFEAQRNHPERSVDLTLVVDPSAPERALKAHRIASITVHADYLPGISDFDWRGDEGAPLGETGPGTRSEMAGIEIGPDFHYIGGKRELRPELVRSAIVLEPGRQYSRSHHLASIDRLLSLGLFQYVSIRYAFDAAGELHAHVYLTPLPEKRVEGAVRMVTRSNGLSGPGVQLGYRDRNLFGGAEHLGVDLSTAIDLRVGREQSPVERWELGGAVHVSAPRLVVPVVSRSDTPESKAATAIPRTEVRAGLQTLRRMDAYRLDQASLSLGYAWSSGSVLRHELRPVEITFVRPTDFSPSFTALLAERPSLRAGFDEQFIVGASYSVLAESAPGPVGRTAARATVELAGNAISLGERVVTGSPPDAETPTRILNTPYSQFVRVDSDTRHYLPVTDRSRLAGRLLAGAGYAYGNSAALPVSRQFTVGGPNSIRAVRSGSIGPGALPPLSEGGPPFDRSGDVRLEANIEYRFPVAGFLNGALFADGGNAWTLSRQMETSDARNDAPDGRLQPRRILAESAFGAGLGARLDFSFLVLRLDAATLLHKPWLAEGRRWVLDEIAPTSRDWRRNNLVLNLALGYPF